jgi:archaemetzincin
MASSGPTCDHNTLHVEVSPHAEEAGFFPPSASKLAAAANPSGRAPGSSKDQAIVLDSEISPADFETFYPAPLVLPGDALAVDPGYHGQDLRSWIQLRQRNAVTERRKTIYVASAPVIADEVSVMGRWTAPLGKSRRQKPQVKPLDPDHVIEYLAAFYHGLPVKPYPETFRFVSWDEKPAKKQSFVGLAVGNFCTRVRARPPPDGKFTRQLNLNDVLDTLLANLPADAFAVILLVDHDLYEDEDDDFCCGRAYGGSRICVVSSARYRPELDDHWDIDLQHMWPASHCASYVNKMCGLPQSKSGSKTQLISDKEARLKPLRAAVEAAKGASPPVDDLYGLWLSRFVRTASHELGHCFALDHCIYYACVMQSTTGMAEDVRQPPYLCPVCLKKVTRAILDVNKGIREDVYLAQRDLALLKYCDDWKNNAMFAGYGAWLDCMLNPSVQG